MPYVGRQQGVLHYSKHVCPPFGSPTIDSIVAARVTKGIVVDAYVFANKSVRLAEAKGG
jgi:hypothetical protein